MPFDVSTYQPGDPWTSTDFLVRALTAPRIEMTATVAGEATEPSYFECRGRGKLRHVEVAVYATDDQPCEVHLQRSFDDGATWETAKVFTDYSAQETVQYNSLYMLRLVLVSSTAPVSLRLWQDL